MDTKKFSPWMKWNDRKETDNIKMPGIYAIAIVDQSIEGNDFKLLKEIVYFGMTNSQGGLISRLKAFDNTIKNKTGHGGASRFKYEHIDRHNSMDSVEVREKLEEELISKLYVSIAPFNREGSKKPFSSNDLITMGDVAKAEYECFAEYFKEFKYLPQFNDMKKSPKKAPKK